MAIHPSGASPPSGRPAPSLGRRPQVSRLLVADRGEVARRVIRTAREMGISTAAVFTEADRDAPAAREADEALALDGLSARGADAYLDGPALIEAARRAGADAVHPGGGALAGDAGFAWRCAEAGLLYAGPSPEALATFGSRLEARALAAAAGVPVLPTEEIEGYPPGKLEAAAEVLGWPVVVKAAAGTAGRALAVVGEGDDLPGTVEAVRRAAGAASGDPTVFLEPWVEPVRHIEVQIFGDVTGRVVHLFERDCSLQRRYEALVVEAPAPRLAQPLRERLHAAAIAVGEAAGYVGAGSVAFLVAGDRLWFLSLSPRLSAGHGVTEALLGLDLVRMQLAAAEGRPLPVEARHCSPSGHAVAAHLWAEDPAAGYRPDAGLLRRLEIPAGSGLRVEAGAAAGSVVGREPGGRLATLVTHAGSRPEAVRRLAMALEGARIHGLRTNRDQLAAALRHPDFVTADVDTGFLHRHHDELCRSRGGPAAVRLHAVAAALTGLAGDDRSRRETVAFAAPGGGRVEVAYRIDGRGTLAEVAVDGEIVAGLRVDGLDPAGVDLEVDGIRRRVAVTRAGVVVDCDSRLGHTELVELDPSAAAG